jgi:hypothetical protein
MRVVVRIRGEVTDAKIIRFFERVNAETLKTFSGEDFLTVDLVRRKQPLSAALKERARKLVSADVLERAGPGYRLSGRLLAEIDVPDGEASTTSAERVAVLAQVQASGQGGASVSEIMRERNRSREQVRWMLSELRRADLVHSRGRGVGARWYAGRE